MNKTISKKELQEMGFLPYQAVDIIRQAKYYMVEQGYPYYNNKRLGRVPCHAVENIIGVDVSLEEGDEWQRLKKSRKDERTGKTNFVKSEVWSSDWESTWCKKSGSCNLKSSTFLSIDNQLS